ncbi:hypothetical protein [Streptomyces sp. RB13]|uniref:hypothetical protein n=1 Tax=Streptomyces sp. RB13 TaxID=2950978 RepID=UPI002FC99876
MSDPRRLSDADLLVWSVVLGYREQQKRDGIRVLLLPLPRCPACNTAVLEGAASWVRDIGREEVTISMRPCGHKHWATLRAVEELQDHISAMLGSLKYRMITTDEIVREAHARLDQPEATEATDVPAPVEPWTRLEARAFNAVQPALNEAGAWLPMSVRRKVARAVLAEILEPVEAGTDAATWTAVRAIQLMNEAGQQRDEARAAIARVCGLADRLDEFAENALRVDDRKQYAGIASDIRTRINGAAVEAADGAPCSCGGRFPLAHLHADQHQPEEQP